MITLGIMVVEIVIGVIGLGFLAVFAFLGFILVFGGIAKITGIIPPKTSNRRA